MKPLAAVLTGDLIASTEAGPVATNRAIEVLSEAAGRLSDWAGADTRFTRHRGDGWQLYLEFPGLVLRATVYLTACLRANDTGLATRISAAIGRVDHLDAKDLSSASGEAFTIAGQNLDMMPRTKRFALGNWMTVNKWQVSIFDLVDWQSRRWSREQAEAVALALPPEEPTQGQIAMRLGITRQALQARLNSAGLSAMTEALCSFESHDWQEEVT